MPGSGDSSHIGVVPTDRSNSHLVGDAKRMYDSEFPVPKQEIQGLQFPQVAAANAWQSAENPRAGLIGLGGLLRSGKDAAADFLVAERGYVKLGMSDALADSLYALADLYVPLGVPDDVNTTWVPYQSYVDELGYVEAKKNPVVRRLLQQLGTEVGRDIIGPNTWVDIIERRIREHWAAGSPVVVTGIRFPNELEMVRRLGGTSVWVQRDAESPSKASDPLSEAMTRHPAGKGRREAQSAPQGHSSENSVSANDFQWQIQNDGTLEQLWQKIDTVAGTKLETPARGMAGWQPGDPCGVCGSRETGWNPVDGGFCQSCGASDADE